MSFKHAISKNLQELRFFFCQTSPESNGLRSYVLKNYLELKNANPNFPFLIREKAGIAPQIYARYDYGQERKVELKNATEQEVEARLAQLINLGESLPRSTESKKN